MHDIFRPVTGSSRYWMVYACHVKLGDQQTTPSIYLLGVGTRRTAVDVRSSVNYDPNVGDRMLIKQYRYTDEIIWVIVFICHYIARPPAVVLYPQPLKYSASDRRGRGNSTCNITLKSVTWFSRLIKYSSNCAIIVPFILLYFDIVAGCNKFINHSLIRRVYLMTCIICSRASWRQ